MGASCDIILARSICRYIRRFLVNNMQIPDLYWRLPSGASFLSPAPPPFSERSRTPGCTSILRLRACFEQRKRDWRGIGWTVLAETGLTLSCSNMLSQAHSEEGRMRDSIPRTPFFSDSSRKLGGLSKKGVEKEHRWLLIEVAETTMKEVRSMLRDEDNNVKKRKWKTNTLCTRFASGFLWHNHTWLNSFEGKRGADS